MGKKTIAIVMACMLLVGSASAYLMTQYGSVSIDADTEQAVLIDGTDSVTGSADIVSGTSVTTAHTLSNDAEQSVDYSLSTTVSPSDEGITTTYHKIKGYAEYMETTTQPAVITVEDLGDRVRFTLDANESEPEYANGHVQMGLIIGDGSDIKYQIHTNDGIDSTYEDGTPLYSPYDTTLSSECEWNGWHSGCVNTPTSELDFVNVTGDRDLSANTDGIIQMTIMKGNHLDADEFKYAIQVGGDGTEMTPSAFGWTDSDTTNFHTAEIGEQFTGTQTIGLKSDMNFAIVRDFAPSVSPDTYTVDTSVLVE